jgi:hypothetical protein
MVEGLKEKQRSIQPVRKRANLSSHPDSRATEMMYYHKSRFAAMYPML